ncbi:trypsin-like peptidase domain-containing protein [Streptomyces sp. NPDC047974]|uniref:VMAP-C domain-containing protein n=1 Tax=Streptomyces sp. NPDC047974 TaxID=3154343 RepID=UPI0033C26B3A
MDPRRLALIRSGTDRQVRSTGTGYLIAPQLVLTARHVLVEHATDALWPVTSVRLGHPVEGDTTRTSAKLLWEHPEGLDVALLLLEEPSELPGTVRWGSPTGKAPLPYEGLGFPRAAAGETRDVEHLRGFLPPLSGAMNRYVLDQDAAPAPGADGKNAWGGASGTAIFCDDDLLVGIVVQEALAYGARRLHALPARSFLGDAAFTDHLTEHTGTPPELAPLGRVRPPEAGPLGERAPVEAELVPLLVQLLPDPIARVAHARELARELGYDTDGYAPSLADLAALLVAHPRALASLGASLAPQAAEGSSFRARLTALFLQARVLGCGFLLSLHEYEALLDLLRGLCKEQPTLLSRAARAALRYGVLPEALARPHLVEDDLDGVIEGLEALTDSKGVPDSTPPVPALLRVVEYVAAASDAAVGAGLRAWSTATADRLGIHLGALGERRADAVEWASLPASPVSRVVMELRQDESAADERYRCRIVLVRMDGTPSVIHEADSTSKTPEEAARCLRATVAAARKEPGQGYHVPWVTVVVDRAGLHLAVDEWEPGAPNDFVPGQPIGAEYRVTLSCPELSEYVTDRADAQQHRWKHGGSVALVTDPTCGNSTQLAHLLQNDHRDTAQVVLHGPADQRASWLLLCLALGVPVVLWDRDAVTYEDADKLHTLRPSGPPDELPERVRNFRSRSHAHPGPARARPSLVWEPDGRYPEPEPLELRDPLKGTQAS